MIIINLLRMDQLQKLRLKILTNTNLKFLCTANKDWTV